MNWQEVCEDKTLQDLPFKIELNERGQVVMSPASNRHGRYQMLIGLMLGAHTENGEIISECSIETKRGVKVADVVWASDSFIQKNGYETPYRAAPELCIEIASPSNSPDEIKEKVSLYLSGGAREVWVCDEDGQLSFYGKPGSLKRSKLISRFPNQI
jgi:Uma2 family endonuclease